MRRSILIIVILLFTQMTVKTQSFTPLSDSLYSEMLWLASGKNKKVHDTTSFIIRTSPIYVVVSVTNANTGEEKIICTTYNRLEGAIRIAKSTAEIDYQNGYFKFYSEKALRTVDFLSYDKKMKDSCISRVTVEQLRNDWEENIFKFWNTYSGECQKYYAHLLFNNGILSSKGSLNSEFSIENKEAVKRQLLELKEN